MNVHDEVGTVQAGVRGAGLDLNRPVQPWQTMTMVELIAEIAKMEKDP